MLHEQNIHICTDAIGRSSSTTVLALQVFMSIFSLTMIGRQILGRKYTVSPVPEKHEYMVYVLAVDERRG